MHTNTEVMPHTGCVCSTDPGETDREADAERQIAIEMARQHGWVIVGGTAFLLHAEPSQRVFGFGELDVHAEGDPFAHAYNLVQMLTISFPFRAFRAVPTGTGAHQTVRVLGRSQVIADITGVHMPTPHEICMSHPLFRGCFVMERFCLINNLQEMLANPELFFRHEKDYARLAALTAAAAVPAAQPQLEAHFATEQIPEVTRTTCDAATETVAAAETSFLPPTEHATCATMTDDVVIEAQTDLCAEFADLRGRLEEAQNELEEQRHKAAEDLQKMRTLLVELQHHEVRKQEVVLQQQKEDCDEDRLSGKATPPKLVSNASPLNTATTAKKQKKKNKKQNKKKGEDAEAVEEEMLAQAQRDAQQQSLEQERNAALVREAAEHEKAKSQWKDSFQKRIDEYERRQRIEIEERLAAAKRLANKMIERARKAETEAEELKERLGDFKDVSNLLMQNVVDLNNKEASCARLIPLVTTAFPLPGTVRVSSSEMFGQSNVLFVNQYAADFMQLTDIITRTEMAVRALFADCVRDTLSDRHANCIDTARCMIYTRMTGKCNIHEPADEAFYGPQHPIRVINQLKHMERRNQTFKERLEEAFLGLEPSLGTLLTEPFFAVEREYLKDKVKWPLMLDFRVCLRIDCIGYLARIEQ